MSPKEVLEAQGLKKLGDLVKFLCTSADSKYYDRSEASIRSFLSQTLNGVRKAPDELRESILEYFKKNRTAADLEILSTNLNTSFNHIFFKHHEPEDPIETLADVIVAEKNDYPLLLKYIKTAKTVTTYTAEPAEVKNNSKADELKNELLKKVGVITTSEQLASYYFYLARGGGGLTIPFNFWEGLYKYALKIGINDIESKFQLANSFRLKVFIVDDDEIDITHGVIDENTPNQISFITVYNRITLRDIEEINVIREEGRNLGRVLRRLDKLRKIYKDEYSFADALEKIHRNQ